jgi:hypothetical protein
VALAIVAGIGYLRLAGGTSVSVQGARRQLTAGCAAAQSAYNGRDSGVWLSVSGTVERVLPDGVGRLRHQRFIVRCAGGLTVLVVNDVSIGERVPVRVGSGVGVRGQYEWNPLGGLIHFTHHREGGGQPRGWILYAGRVYALIAPRG